MKVYDYVISDYKIENNYLKSNTINNFIVSKINSINYDYALRMYFFILSGTKIVFYGKYEKFDFFGSLQFLLRYKNELYIKYKDLEYFNYNIFNSFDNSFNFSPDFIYIFKLKDSSYYDYTRFDSIFFSYIHNNFENVINDNLFYASKDSLSRNTLFSRKLSFSFINNKLPYFDDFSNLLSLQYANYKNDLFNINQFIQSLILNGFTVIDYQEDNNFDDYTLSYYCKIYNLDKNIYYEFFLSLNKKAEYINNFNVLDSNNNKIKSYNNLDLKKFDFSKLDLETEVLEITKEKLFVDSDIEFEIKNKLKLGGVF